MFATAAFNFFENCLCDIPTNYLEIGVYNGDSIQRLALAFPDKLIVGVDPFIEDGCTSHNSKVNAGERLIAQELSTKKLIKGIPNIMCFKQTSKEFFTRLPDNVVTFLNIGAVFIDGSHHYEDVKKRLPTSYETAR